MISMNLIDIRTMNPDSPAASCSPAPPSPSRCSPAPSRLAPPPPRRRRRHDRQAAAAGVVHPARHERRDALGRGARARPPRARTSASSSATTPRRRRSTRARGGCACSAAACAARPGSPQLRRAPPAAVAQHHRGDRVRGQRPQLLRVPAGHAGRGQRLEARRDRRRALARRAAARGARARRRHAAAVDVLPQGLDARGRRRDGHVRRPLPIAKALDDVLLAYEMNGAPLPPDHGFPVRLVVPGWVGIASIKWLGDIEVADHPLPSPWSTTSYRMVGPAYPPDAPPLDRAAGQERVRAALGGAARRAAARCGSHGRSWSGAAPIRARRGEHRRRRALAARPAARAEPPRAWVRWSLRWRPRGAGPPRAARARDGPRRGGASPRPSRSTSSATSSGRWCATRSS